MAIQIRGPDNTRTNQPTEHGAIIQQSTTELRARYNLNTVHPSAPTKTSHSMTISRRISVLIDRGRLVTKNRLQKTERKVTKSRTHTRHARPTLLGGKRTSSGVTSTLVLIVSSQGRTTDGPLSCSPTAPPVEAALAVEELSPCVSRGFGTGMLPRYLRLGD